MNYYFRKGGGKLKKIWIITLTLLLFVAFAMPISGQAASKDLYGVALKSPTYVYASASTNSSKLKSYAVGSVLKYRSYSSTWYAATVYVNGKAKHGYIYAKDVETATTSPVTLEGIAIKSPTRVYASASTSKVLKSYSLGSILKYQTFTSKWYRATVYVNGKAKTGYILKSDVDTATQNPTARRGIGLKSPTKVYSKASVSSSSLKSYAQGTVLKYQTFTSQWYKATVYIKGHATTGYIYKSDVGEITSRPVTSYGIGIKNPTYVYEKASAQSSKLKSYQLGSKLKYETFAPGWYQATVYINGKPKTGYISQNDVDGVVSSMSLRGIGTKSPTKVYAYGSTSANALKSYPQGAVLSYKALSTHWYLATVYVNGKPKNGLIHVGDVENADPKPSALQGVGLQSPTRVYSYASTGAKVLKSYSRGTVLQYKTFTSGWYEATVYINGKPTKGYIKKDDVGSKITTNYNISLNTAIAMQMNVSPKIDGAGEVAATVNQVRNYLDPENFINDPREMYQFLILSSYTGTNASELNNEFLAGMGVLDGTASYFIEAAKKYNINELYLISHALHETGNGTSNLAKGIKVNGKPVYNVYGVGALDGKADETGSQYAYEQEWFTLKDAIIEGAQFISTKYIHNGQDTLYKMRWNPASMVNKGYASHQYASDVGWASKQTYELSQMYSRLSTYSLAFDIPNYVGDSTDLYIVKPGTGTLRIRASYSTSSTVLRTVNDNDYVAVVLSKGKPVSKVSGGYTWYEVSLGAQNGWVASEYLKKP